MRFALKVWQRFSQGRTRATSSFRKYQFLGSNRDKGRFFSWRDNKVTKVPIIPLGGERERGGEGGEESYINLRIIAEFFHNPTLFYSDTLLNTLSPISYVTQWSLAVLITFNSISQLVLISWRWAHTKGIVLATRLRSIQRSGFPPNHPDSCRWTVADTSPCDKMNAIVNQYFRSIFDGFYFKIIGHGPANKSSVCLY